MVKISVIGKRPPPHPPGTEIDPGFPITHPVVMLPLIGLIIMGTVALVTCFCKCWPALIPERMKIFGKRSIVDPTVQLQLGRRSPRRPSEASQNSGRSANPHNHHRKHSKSRTPSFNTNNSRMPNGSKTLETPPPVYPQANPLPPPYEHVSGSSLRDNFISEV